MKSTLQPAAAGPLDQHDSMLPGPCSWLNLVSLPLFSVLPKKCFTFLPVSVSTLSLAPHLLTAQLLHESQRTLLHLSTPSPPPPPLPSALPPPPDMLRCRLMEVRHNPQLLPHAHIKAAADAAENTDGVGCKAARPVPATPFVRGPHLPIHQVQ